MAKFLIHANQESSLFPEREAKFQEEGGSVHTGRGILTARGLLTGQRGPDLWRQARSQAVSEPCRGVADGAWILCSLSPHWWELVRTPGFWAPPVTGASAHVPSRVSETTCTPCSAWPRTQWGPTPRGPMTSTCCTQESKAASPLAACQPSAPWVCRPLLPRPGWGTARGKSYWRTPCDR